jgi:hypothetical protein
MIFLFAHAANAEGFVEGVQNLDAKFANWYSELPQQLRIDDASVLQQSPPPHIVSLKYVLLAVNCDYMLTFLKCPLSCASNSSPSPKPRLTHAIHPTSWHGCLHSSFKEHSFYFLALRKDLPISSYDISDQLLLIHSSDY